jgi:hypothetical protein
MYSAFERFPDAPGKDGAAIHYLTVRSAKGCLLARQNPYAVPIASMVKNA